MNYMQYTRPFSRDASREDSNGKALTILELACTEHDKDCILSYRGYTVLWLSMINEIIYPKWNKEHYEKPIRFWRWARFWKHQCQWIYAIRNWSSEQVETGWVRMKKQLQWQEVSENQIELNYTNRKKLNSWQPPSPYS